MPELLKELRDHHTVKILKGFTRTRVEKFMREIDVLYSEWCSNYMTYVTHVPNPTRCKIVCRLHRHELHGSWMQSYLTMGWTYGEVYDREKRIHPDLVPYSQLGQLERDKDAVFVALCEIARQFIYDI